MSITNTYYKRNEKRLQERSQNRYHQEDVKKAKEYYKNKRERFREHVRSKYKELFNEEKDRKIEYEKKSIQK